MTTSQPARPSRMSWKTSQPQRSASPGTRVGGPISRTRAPIIDSRATLDRATRLWAMSPQMATVSPPTSPKARRRLNRSSRAWVGCSCRPSPALTTAQPTFCDSRAAAPDAPCRTTRMSGFMAFRVTAVSIRVSPFFTELAWTGMVTTSAPRRLAAISNEELVRVEFSKNRFITVLPRSRSSCLVDWRFRSTNESARSSRLNTNGGFRSPAARKWGFGNGTSRSAIRSAAASSWVIEARLYGRQAPTSRQWPQVR